MNNGNGKTSPAVVEAQRTVAAAEKPLREAEKRAATTRLRLSEAEQVVAQAAADHDASEEAYVESDSAAHKQALKQTYDNLMAARSRVEGFKRKLATEEASIAPLKATYDEATVALAAVLFEEKLTHAEEVWSAARYAVTEHEARAVQLRQVEAEARAEFERLSRQKRESDQRHSMQQAHIRFRQANPSTPGFERQRAGF